MAIDFVQGTDSEEKRFLAGVMLVFTARALKRGLLDVMAEKLKKPDSEFSYAEFDFRQDKTKVERYEQLRRRGMSMIGADDTWLEIDQEDLEVVADLLTRFDVVREVMGA